MSSIVGGVTAPALGPTGFQQMRQADWTSFLNGQWTSAFGNNVNLDPRSNNGQIIAIMAERFALLSELAEAVAQQSTVSGAQGVNVDNILALTGLTRLTATPTVTQPTPLAQANGVTLYGLAVLGTPGTVVPAGSLIADTASPPHQLSIDAAITIAAAANAVQSLVFSGVASSGSFALGLTAPSGAVLTTPALAAAATAQTTQLVWATPPTAGNFTLTIGQATLPEQAFNVSATALAAAIATAVNSSVQVTGTQASGMVITWPSGVIPNVTASSDAAAPQVINPAQAAINGLQDGASGTAPFTDVAVTSAGNTWTLAFGAHAPSPGQPASASQAQPLVVIGADTLLAGNTVVNVTAAVVQQGAPAQGIGTATCTTTGNRPHSGRRHNADCQRTRRLDWRAQRPGLRYRHRWRDGYAGHGPASELAGCARAGAAGGSGAGGVGGYRGHHGACIQQQQQRGAAGRVLRHSTVKRQLPAVLGHRQHRAYRLFGGGERHADGHPSRPRFRPHISHRQRRLRIHRRLRRRAGRGRRCRCW